MTRDEMFEDIVYRVAEELLRDDWTPPFRVAFFGEDTLTSPAIRVYRCDGEIERDEDDLPDLDGAIDTGPRESIYETEIESVRIAGFAVAANAANVATFAVEIRGDRFTLDIDMGEGEFVPGRNLVHVKSDAEGNLETTYADEHGA